MGAATIVGGGTGGLYTVKLEYHDGIDGQLAMLASRRSALEAALPQLRAALATIQANLSAAESAVDTLVNAWIAGLPMPSGNFASQWSPGAMTYIEERAAAMKVPPAVVNAIGNMRKLAWQAIDAELALDRAYAEYLSLTTREAELGRLKEDGELTVSAWCADFTEDLTGTVATMEVPGEIEPLTGGGINIRPGYNDQAVYSASYGKIQRSTLMSEAGFAWNFTMIQPWMKWMPIWRYATVTGKNENNNTVNVNLQPIRSKAGAWLAKQTDFNDWVGNSLSAVPVVYMSCGAQVFEPGDEVVIEFRISGGRPTPFCIGFKQEPKECPVFSGKLYIQLGSGNATNLGTTVHPLYTYGWDFTQSISQNKDSYDRLTATTINYSEYAIGELSGFGDREMGITSSSYQYSFKSLAVFVFGGNNYSGAAGGTYEIENNEDLLWGNGGSWPGTSFRIYEADMGVNYPQLRISVFSYTASGGLYSDSASNTYYYHSNQISPLLEPPTLTLKFTKNEEIKTKVYTFSRVVFQKTPTPIAVADEDFDQVWCLDSAETPNPQSNPDRRESWQRKIWAEYVAMGG